jgi:hypothetical protein
LFCGGGANLQMRWIRRVFSTTKAKIPITQTLENIKSKNRVLREVYMDDLREVLNKTKERILLPEGNDYVSKILGTNSAARERNIKSEFSSKINVSKLEEYSLDEICEALEKDGINRAKMGMKSLHLMIEFAANKNDGELGYRILEILKKYPTLCHQLKFRVIFMRIYMACLRNWNVEIINKMHGLIKKPKEISLDQFNTERIFKSYMRNLDLREALEFLERSNLFVLDKYLVSAVLDCLIYFAKINHQFAQDPLIEMEQFIDRNRIDCNLRIEYKRATFLAVSGHIEKACLLVDTFNEEGNSRHLKMSFLMEIVKKCASLGDVSQVRKLGMKMLENQMLGDVKVVELILKSFSSDDPNSLDNELWHHRGYDLFENFISSKHYKPNVSSNSNIHEFSCFSPIHCNSSIIYVMIEAYLRHKQYNSAIPLINRLEKKIKMMDQAQATEIQASLNKLIAAQPESFHQRMQDFRAIDELDPLPQQ